MQDEVYDMILERSKTVDPLDFARIRAYTLVLMCINTGTRNKEIRFAEVRDLDTRTWMFEIVHVKGEATYGQPREVPIRPEIRQLILTYLLARQRWVVDNSVKSQALFPSKDSADGFLSGNAIRKIKEVVERDLGIEFDLRECRRTFGQRYLDSDLDIESVSVLMGHASTKTTESFYSRKRMTKAVESAKRTWDEDGGQ
jgi:integrase/recombinase XerD